MPITGLKPAALEKQLIDAKDDKIKREKTQTAKQEAFDKENAKVKPLQTSYDAAQATNKTLAAQHKSAMDDVAKANKIVNQNQIALDDANKKLSASPNDPILQQLVTLAKTELDAAKALLATKETEAAVIKKRLDDSNKDVAAKKKPLDEAKKKHKGPEKELSDAKEAVANVEERIKSLNKALEGAQNSVATLAAGSAQFEKGSDPCCRNIDPVTATAVSKAVENIVRMTFNDDEFERTCLSLVNNISQRADKIFEEDLKKRSIDSTSENEKSSAGIWRENTISGIDSMLNICLRGFNKGFNVQLARELADQFGGEASKAESEEDSRSKSEATPSHSSETSSELLDMPPEQQRRVLESILDQDSDIVEEIIRERQKPSDGSPRNLLRDLPPEGD